MKRMMKKINYAEFINEEIYESEKSKRKMDKNSRREKADKRYIKWEDI